MSERLDLIRDIFEHRRRQADRTAETATGMGQERFQQIDRVIGSGIRNGSIRFKPGASSDGGHGTLYVTFKENGREAVHEEFTVTNDAEAAALIGLQQEADQRAHRR